MFNTLCNRLVNKLGSKTFSVDDLNSADLDSLDTICISETHSTASTDRLVHDFTNLMVQTANPALDRSLLLEIDRRAKRKVSRILNSVIRLQKYEANSLKITLLSFMDMLHDQEYKTTSMSLLDEFMKDCRIVPKNNYIHYLIYMLYYVIYYHFKRMSSEVIDKKMCTHHEYQYLFAKKQLTYLKQIIKKAKTDQ